MKRRDIIRLLGGAATWPFAARATVSDELLIDLKTANSLGITIPQALLSRADEVIRVGFATTVLTLATYCTATRPQSANGHCGNRTGSIAEDGAHGPTRPAPTLCSGNTGRSIPVAP
jgi:hypothetical protein